MMILSGALARPSVFKASISRMRESSSLFSGITFSSARSKAILSPQRRREKENIRTQMNTDLLD
jgi:hypothetical protein